MATTIDYILLDYNELGTPKPRLAVRVDNGLKDNALAFLLDNGSLLYQSEGENLVLPEKGDVISYGSSNGRNKRYEVVIREISEPQIPDLNVKVGIVEIKK